MSSNLSAVNPISNAEMCMPLPQQARTPLIALFDVDMLPSKTMFHELEDPARLQWCAGNAKAAWLCMQQ